MVLIKTVGIFRCGPDMAVGPAPWFLAAGFGLGAVRRGEGDEEVESPLFNLFPT